MSPVTKEAVEQAAKRIATKTPKWVSSGIVIDDEHCQIGPDNDGAEHRPASPDLGWSEERAREFLHEFINQIFVPLPEGVPLTEHCRRVIQKNTAELMGVALGVRSNIEKGIAALEMQPTCMCMSGFTCTRCKGIAALQSALGIPTDAAHQ